jgi:hypothetical protein
LALNYKIEGKGSHAGAIKQEHQHPWKQSMVNVKLDRKNDRNRIRWSQDYLPFSLGGPSMKGKA